MMNLQQGSALSTSWGANAGARTRPTIQAISKAVNAFPPGTSHTGLANGASDKSALIAKKENICDAKFFGAAPPGFYSPFSEKQI